MALRRSLDNHKSIEAQRQNNYTRHFHDSSAVQYISHIDLDNRLKATHYPHLRIPHPYCYL